MVGSGANHANDCAFSSSTPDRAVTFSRITEHSADTKEAAKFYSLFPFLLARCSRHPLKAKWGSAG